MPFSPRRRATVLALGLCTTLSLAATSCSLLGDDDGKTTPLAVAGNSAVESGLDGLGTPQRGGQLVYGLEAEVSTGGYCLPEAQLAISGMQVARAIFDTLTVPDSSGGYAPYLAKSVKPSADHKTWTITLRPGITFHDGTALDATVVKNNLDAYRGKYPTRNPLLFTFVLRDIAEVTVVNELTVEVTTKVPWVAFPAALYSSGRLGIMAQRQLDAEDAICSSRPVGTGPFTFSSWTPGASLKVTRNTKYWQLAPDNEPYPYLNAIEFVPVPNSDERLAQFMAGELNIIHTSGVKEMGTSLAQLREEGAINLMISDVRTETSYLMLNQSTPLLQDLEVRQAIAQAIDRKALNDEVNGGFATLADGPFAPDVLGYLEDPGRVDFDPDKAKATVAAVKKRGDSVKLRLLTSISPAAVRLAEAERRMLEAVGFEIEMVVTTEADLIDLVIGGDYDLAAFRNQPGEDPDMNMVWWYGEGNPVNFGRFDDPVINKNLQTGRSTADPDKRAAAYQEINRSFAKNQWNVYLWYTPWAVAELSNVHGILGPDLPGDGGPPPAQLRTGHSLLGLWIDRS